MKKKKLPSLKSLKAKAWRLHSEWIRRKNANYAGYASCVCCGSVKLWNDGLDCGHFVHDPGHWSAVSFDDRNTNVQCARCNRFGADDAHQRYSLFMFRTYGEGILDELRSIKAQSRLKRGDFERIIQELTEKIEGLNPS